jgi:hypothetical protein
VLFPLPDAPTRAAVLPASKSIETPLRIGTSGREGYSNLTSSKVMRPVIFSGRRPSSEALSMGGTRSIVAKILVAAPRPEEIARMG